MDKRMTMPQYRIHGPSFYTDLLDKVNIISLLSKLYFSLQVYAKGRKSVMDRLETDDPESMWPAMDGWSAVTTGYIGAEICKLYIFDFIFQSYLLTIYSNGYLSYNCVVHVVALLHVYVGFSLYVREFCICI